MKVYLKPTLGDLSLESVLMQAWKKTSSYLRYHSWYSDTLEVDYQSLRIREFLFEIQERLTRPEEWLSKPLYLVPAPKSKSWEYHDNVWAPSKGVNKGGIRPLAHVDLQDQVVATAILLCLSDRIENYLGDPRKNIENKKDLPQVMAYGHRLFCDKQEGGDLRHRWGSSKLYRSYFQDYRSFLNRPGKVVDFLDAGNKGQEIAFVQTDLAKFYDNVTPDLLSEKMSKFKWNAEEMSFFKLAGRVFQWEWSNKDKKRALRYAKENDIGSDFTKVALPQGLVAAGFFANIALHDLDVTLKKTIGKELPGSGFILQDACYYVDDFRLVLSVPGGSGEEGIRKKVIEWLNGLLDAHARGLRVSELKTTVTVEGREKRLLIKQSREANRIQKQASGVFDMHKGVELISAIEGFFSTQKRFPSNDPDGGLLIGVPDMGDETAFRFSANKYRVTFRSLRPLLADSTVRPQQKEDSADLDNYVGFPDEVFLTREQLDEKAKLFATWLVEAWIKNPGNVRLLRVGLDICPSEKLLSQVLNLLRPGWNDNIKKEKREVCLYCLAELFRAGSIETGMVNEDECLPSEASVSEYHDTLAKEAKSLLSIYTSSSRPSPNRFPWYLMQQVYLYLIARKEFNYPNMKSKRKGHLLSRYCNLAKILGGCAVSNTPTERAIMDSLLMTAFGYEASTLDPDVTSREYLEALAKISPKIAYDTWVKKGDGNNPKLMQTVKRYGLDCEAPRKRRKMCLNEVCRLAGNPFWDEANILELAKWLLLRSLNGENGPLTPWGIECTVEKKKGYEFNEVSNFSYMAGEQQNPLFTPPDWCEDKEEKDKFRIGLILKYAIKGASWFYDRYQPAPLKNNRYRKPVTCWEQQIYSGYFGRDALGPAWLPVSRTTEDLLFELLKWPGAGIGDTTKSIKKLTEDVEECIQNLKKRRGELSSVTFLKQKAVNWPSITRPYTQSNGISIGIVQSILPKWCDYKKNPQLLNDASLQIKLRNHLTAILGGVNQMLRIRNSCTVLGDGRKNGLDLLIFPELAIRPMDINTYLLPFVRQYKCTVLCGLSYHPQSPLGDNPLINSCLWIVPEQSTGNGMRLRYVEQGKKHLAKVEKKVRAGTLVGFRPAQWLIEYKWCQEKPPLIITASVCYDSTDLAMAADLRNRSNLYIICAFNKDIRTFDTMSESLHYHMYQGVIVVNNGTYGGSSYYLPKDKYFKRQVLHLHGQPQATIAFVDVNAKELLERKGKGKEKWKSPPAGFKKG